MADDFTSCKTKDDPDYDYFACQFFDSMTRYQTTDPKGYWIGRLLARGFTVGDLLGNNFDEDTFREDLENADIILHGYTLDEVNYMSETSQPATVVLTGKVELDITINGKRQTVARNFKHRLKRSWQSTEIILC